MAGIKVFGNAASTSTRRVLLALHEKNLDFELVNIDLKDGEHKKEPFLSRNVSISICVALKTRPAVLMNLVRILSVLRLVDTTAFW